MNHKDRDALEEVLKVGISATETQRRSLQAFVENLIQSAILQEREACALICDSFAKDCEEVRALVQVLAKTIRGRSK